MKKYQFSSFDERTPISCSVQAIDNMDSHIHDFFELDMVLSGTGSLSVDDRLYNLEPDDVFSIDPHVPHELRGKDCVLIACSGGGNSGKTFEKVRGYLQGNTVVKTLDIAAAKAHPETVKEKLESVI